MENLLPCTCPALKKKRKRNKLTAARNRCWYGRQRVRVHASCWSQQASQNMIIWKDSNTCPHWSHTNNPVCRHTRDSNLAGWSNHFISSAFRQNTHRLSTRSVPTLSSSLIIRAPIVGCSLSSPLPAKERWHEIKTCVKEIVIAKWKKKKLCLSTPARTLKANVCRHGKSFYCSKTLQLFSLLNGWPC